MSATSQIKQTVENAARIADAAIQRLAIHEAIAAIWKIVDELNGYITLEEPWVLAKDDATRERLGTVLYTAAEGLRALAVLLSPVIPDSTAKLWEALGASAGLGTLDDQLIPDAGRWGQLPAGATVARVAGAVPED